MTERSTSSHCYPAMSQYTGGGSILNGYTTVRNVIAECESHDVSIDEALRLIRDGFECIILNGEIKGIQRKRNAVASDSTGM